MIVCHHGRVGLARLVLRVCGAQLCLGGALGADLHRVSQGSSAHHARQELAILPAPRDKVAPGPLGPLFKRMAPVTIVYFCYGWTLWLFLSWIPQYFLHSQNLDLKQSALFSSGVFFAGVMGDTLGRDSHRPITQTQGSLRRARSSMVSVCMLMTAAVAHSPDVHPRSRHIAAVACRRLLLFRNDHRSNVGNPDGYCPRLLAARRAA